MGTNYYLHLGVCSKCGHSAEKLHIGKSSMGWCFALNTYLEKGITRLEDWLQLFPKGTIKNEYGAIITPLEMLQTIAMRTNGSCNRNVALYGYSSVADMLGGYSSVADMLEANQAEWGPNNLLRRRIDGRHCVAHGPGTWDIIRGEFS